MTRSPHRTLPAVSALALAGTALLALPATAGSYDSTGTGTVFKVNAVQATGVQTLVDAKDSDSAVPPSAYAQVALERLDGSGTLTGRWANVRAETGTPARSADLTFDYPRSDDRFEQVMAYFWVDTAQEYLRSLGFDGVTYPEVNAESQDVRVNQWGQDNSYSWDKHDVIRLGKGGVDDGEDGEVVVHEYGHAVHDSQVAGFGSSLDAGAIGEAFGDYLSVVVGLDAAADHGWPVLAPEACVADWDAVSYTSSEPHCLRRVDTAYTVADRRQRVHFDGQIWSGALWDARQALGDGEMADTVVVLAQFDFAPDTSWQAAAETTVATARAEFGDAVGDVYQAAFEGRGIL